jgi:ribosome biogenesis protein UTP30
MPAAKLLQNLQTALPEIIKHLTPAKRKRAEDDGDEEEDPWRNIQSLMIKTSESASLPIWSCQLGSGSGGRWDGLAAEHVEMEVDDDEEQEGSRKVTAKGKAVKPSSTVEPTNTSKSKGKKRTAEQSEGEPEKKRKKKSVESDEVASKMKRLALEKATLAKGEKAKTEGKRATTNGSTSTSIKIKGPSSTSASSKPAPPNPESAGKPKKLTSEEKASRKAEVSLPLTSTKPPTETKPDLAVVDRLQKTTKTKTAAVHVEPREPKAERKKNAKKEKETQLISTPQPAGPALQARENEAKPLKSAVKSSTSEGIKVKKRISFDLKGLKEGKGKKTGGKLSSKERLVGRGPRNA